MYRPPGYYTQPDYSTQSDYSTQPDYSTHPRSSSWRTTPNFQPPLYMRFPPGHPGRSEFQRPSVHSTYDIEAERQPVASRRRAALVSTDEEDLTSELSESPQPRPRRVRPRQPNPRVSNRSAAPEKDDDSDESQMKRVRSAGKQGRLDAIREIDPDPVRFSQIVTTHPSSPLTTIDGHSSCACL
jgi:hypothetical protein